MAQSARRTHWTHICYSWAVTLTGSSDKAEGKDTNRLLLRSFPSLAAGNSDEDPQTLTMIARRHLQTRSSHAVVWGPVLCSVSNHHHINTHKNTNVPEMCPPHFTLFRSRVYEVVFLKPRTCLNNFSITLKTFEGTPHRVGNKGHDPWVKSVTR